MFWSQISANPALREKIFTGLKNTLLIAALGFIIGVFLGSLLAVAKLLPQKKKGVRVLSKICDVYVAIFRGTPIVVQLLVSYYLLAPLLGIKASGMSVSIVMFGLNSAAYVCEIMRGGILSVDIGQMEAGRSLGLSYAQTMKTIVLPQAIKNILPARQRIDRAGERNVGGIVCGRGGSFHGVSIHRRNQIRLRDPLSDDGSHLHCAGDCAYASSETFGKEIAQGR